MKSQTVREARAELSAAWHEAMKAGTYQIEQVSALDTARGYAKREGLLPTVKAAMRRVWAAHEALELAALREEVAALRIEHRQAVADRETWKMTAEDNGKELAQVNFLLTEERNKTAGFIQRMADVTELDSGAQTLRTMFTDAGCPAERKGLEAMLGWLVDEVKTLRDVNQKRAAAHVPDAEAVAAIASIPGADKLLNLPPHENPHDTYTLQTIRAYWSTLSEDERRAKALCLMNDVVLRVHERGTAWSLAVLTVNERLVHSNITVFPASVPQAEQKEVS